MSGSTDVHFGQMVFLVGQCPMSDTFLQPYTGFYMKSNTELKWVNHISKVRQMKLKQGRLVLLYFLDYLPGTRIVTLDKTNRKSTIETLENSLKYVQI